MGKLSQEVRKFSPGGQCDFRVGWQSQFRGWYWLAVGGNPPVQRTRASDYWLSHRQVHQSSLRLFTDIGDHLGSERQSERKGHGLYLLVPGIFPVLASSIPFHLSHLCGDLALVKLPSTEYAASNLLGGQSSVE